MGDCIDALLPRRLRGDLEKTAGAARVQEHPAPAEVVNLLRVINGGEQGAEAPADAEANAPRAASPRRHAEAVDAMEEGDVGLMPRKASQ